LLRTTSKELSLFVRQLNRRAHSTRNRIIDYMYICLWITTYSRKYK